MEFLNNHFTKGKTYIKILSPLKTPGVVPPPYAAWKYPMRHRAWVESRDIKRARRGGNNVHEGM